MSNTPGNDFESSLISSIKKLDGAFSTLVMGDKNKIIAFKDPYGFKPLAYGKLGDQGYVFSSETAALNILGVTDIKFLEPGELIICENGEIKQKNRLAIFNFADETVMFSDMTEQLLYNFNGSF